MTNWTELKRLAEECPWDQIEGFQYEAVGGKAYCLGSGPSDHLITTFDQRFQKYLEAANPKTILALIAENEALRKRARIAERESGNSLSMLKGLEKVARVVDANSDDVCGENNKLRAEVDALRNSLRQISNEIDCNMRPLIRDLVNRACGLDNGANPNDLYVDCDRIDEIIDSALDSNQ